MLKSLHIDWHRAMGLFLNNSTGVVQIQERLVVACGVKKTNFNELQNLVKFANVCELLKVKVTYSLSVVIQTINHQLYTTSSHNTTLQV